MKLADLDAFLREHGGLGGLAREIGQFGSEIASDEQAANDNAPPRPKGFWQRHWVWRLFRRVR